MTEKYFHGQSSTPNCDAIPEERGIVVTTQFLGTDADRHDMLILGRRQVLRRNFRFLQILGFSAVLICTWEILFANLIFALTDGGTAGLFWGFTVTVIASIFIYLSIAEMASISPTAGGQYHWVSEFAPRRYQKFLSYITGWLLAIGWQGSIVSLAFVAGTSIQGLLTLNRPSYVPHPWHGTLLVIAVATFAMLFNTLFATRLPLIQYLILAIHVVGLFAVIIPLLVTAPRTITAKEALINLYNGGGWSTTGTAVMIGLLTSLGSMLGFDCAVHMSEEIKDASVALPKALLWGAALNALLGYMAVLTICFTVVDPSAIIASATGYPYIQLFYNTTSSYAGADVLVSIIIIALVAAVICEVATASRQIWSFSRDNGLPFSAWLSQVTPRWNMPLNAIAVSFVVTVLVSLINLGSTAALNAIISVTVSALLSSYILSIGCVLCKRVLGGGLPPSRFSLGRFGVAINSIALIFLLPFLVFCFFPTATPVTASTMNWNVVMFWGVIFLATVYYIAHGRQRYVPPVVITKRDM